MFTFTSEVIRGCLATQTVIASPALRVILSPSPLVIPREQSDRRISLRVNSTKNLMAFRTGSTWQSHYCFQRLLRHLVPRNDKRETC